MNSIPKKTQTKWSRKAKIVAIVIFSAIGVAIYFGVRLLHNFADEQAFIGYLISVGLVGFIAIPYLITIAKKRR